MSAADHRADDPVTDGPHFLLVGDGNDVPTLRGIVGRLPVQAYGQVFIEVASDLQIKEWELPDRVSLTWLPRDRATSAVGAVPPRGELVTRAVHAWLAEWMPHQHTEQRIPYIMWIGCSASERVDRLYSELAHHADRISLHHPHRH